VVIVPCQPTIVDVRRAAIALDLAADHNRPALAVLTRVRAGTRSRIDARAALTEMGATVAETEFAQRESIAASYGERLDPMMLDLGSALLAEVTALPGLT
jgi:hypothetical protein